MLDLVPINDADYYKSLSQSEYYTGAEKGEPAGKWGEGAEKIGIDPSRPLDAHTLDQVMMGWKPNGEKLQQNALTPQMLAENEQARKDKKEPPHQMRVGMDLTFSAPKSVSVLWANASPELREQISKAQADAVAEAMRYLRDRVETRTGKKGEHREKPAALIFATFEHSDTREKDPNLHTHTVVSNAVIREDGKTSAIDQNGLYVHKLAAGTTYRAYLAQQLRGMGFKLEEDKDNAGIFQVAGMDKNLEKHFSKRSEQIKAKVKETGMDSAQSRRNHAGNTRKAKEEIDRPALFERWQNESAERGFDASKIDALKEATPEPFTMPTTAKILERLTENESFFEVKDLEQVLAEFGQYQDFDREKMRDEILASPECAKRVWVNERTIKTKNKKDKDKPDVRTVGTSATVYTSQALIDLEKNALDSAAARSTETRHHLPAATVAATIQGIEEAAGFQLRDEQREAVEHLTQKSGGVAILRGLAGTGKTTALKAVSESFKAEGYKVHGATISAQAAGILAKETGLKAATIAQTLIDLDKGKTTLTEKSVLLIDEGGMVGSRDFARLQKHADAAGAKLIAVGDERQLQAIASGGIFEALQRHAGIATADLKTITRQQDAQDREASKLLYEGRAEEALKIYEDKGQIKTHKHRDSLMIQLAKDFANDPSAIDQKMIVAATKSEARLLNEQTREELKAAGQLDRDTGALFENGDGDTLEMSKGDRIIFKKNNLSRGIVNNLKGTVKECHQQGEHSILKIECDDGKTREVNTEDYPHLRHGYAITGHASQGATIQKSFVLFNRGASDLSWGYVALTRHKDRVNLYATEADRPDLAEKFSKAAMKGTTLDLKEYEQATPEAAAGKDMEGSAPSTAQGLASSAGKGQQSAGGQMPQQAAKTTAQAPQAGQAGGIQQSQNTGQKINWSAIERVSPTLSTFLKLSMAHGTNGDASLVSLYEALAAGASRGAEQHEAQTQSQAREQANIQRQGAEMER
ncbi:MAG: MobF family relaxase [Alphaproteobacteria bacterium]|nr:MobF family relaxase [Alphaproteobacteria bacterium]